MSADVPVFNKKRDTYLSFSFNKNLINRLISSTLNTDNQIVMMHYLAILVK